MKKQTYLLLPLIMLAVGCQKTSESDSESMRVSDSMDTASDKTDTSTTDSSTKEQYPSIKEVMLNLSTKKNYTYFLEDKILNNTTEYRFTEKAYYYSYSGREGDSKGYAQSDEGVFSFTINDGEVVPGTLERNSSGEKLTSLWDQCILSFADFRFDALPSEENEDNIYEITDDSNKTLFAAFAGYADAFVLPYVTVSVEVTGEDSFISTVHFAPDNQSYVGDCIGTVKDISITSIPEIEKYLSEGKGPKSEDESFIELLTFLKEARKYKVSVKSTSVDYSYIFNDKYYYFKNNSASTDKGYIVCGPDIYRFNIKDNEVALGKEIDSYSSSYERDDLWNQLSSSFKSFMNLNLSSADVTYDESSKSYSMAYSFSIYNTFYGLLNTSSFASPSETDTLVFSSVGKDSFHFTYTHSSVVYEADVTGIGTASDSLLDSFYDKYKDFDSSDISLLISKIKTIADSKNYTIELTNNFSSFASTLKTGNATIRFTDSDYYYQNTTDDSKSIGYKNEEDKIYSYRLVDSVETDKTEVKAISLYSCFSSLSDLLLTGLTGSRSISGTYTIDSDDFISTIADILRLDSASLVSYVASLSLSFTDTTLTITGTTSFYGSFTAVINY